ncbi:MAG TPA: tetratricopeptide repeat protein, partial [Labilithrix sp.]
MQQTPRQPRTGIPSFENKLENEEDILDAIVNAQAKNTLDPSTWDELHKAAVRDDRVSELAFAYESIAAGRKLKTQLPAVQAELFFRAAVFFGDVLGDEFGSGTYLEKALGAFPGHSGAFDRFDAQLTRTDDNKKLAELCAHSAPHRQRPEQLMLLRRAAVLFERAGLEDKSIEIYQQLVRLDSSDETLRNALEARYIKANRFRDVARMLEQALAASDPAPDVDQAARIRAKLIDVFANQLKEPERAMPHVEALLEYEPTNADARRVATRLLESKGLAARAAAALATGAQTTEERAKFLAVELENTRGPRRRDVLRRIGILKQDELGDRQGAFEAFEQALGIDPADDDLRRRYTDLGCELKGPLDVARTFARVSTVAKDAAVRSKITAEMGELLLRGGDAKRARTTLAGVLSAPSADPAAVLVAARALSGVYEAEKDVKNLLEVLVRVGELASDEEEKQRANERVAELAAESGDVDRAIAAWRRLVDSPARDRALEALEPLYEQRGEWIDLSFILEQRARDMVDRDAARELSFRAAEILTTKAKDAGSASEAWRQMVENYGPSREIYAQWIPILEAQRQWPELAEALAKESELAPQEEKPGILARLGQLYLTRTKDDDFAIAAFQQALAIDPKEKTSRATLEKLLVAGDHRLAAATVLEPVYRMEVNAQGLLRVLDIKAQLSPIVQDRLAALEEAADVAGDVSRDRAVEIIAKGLAEAVESNEPIAPWIERFDRNAEGLERKKRASLLGKALADRSIENAELLALAKRVGEEYAACGDVKEALAAYRRALAFEPTSAELIGRVDELLREQGNPEERVALYRAALERAPDAGRKRKLLHSIGSIERYELHNPDAAIFAYKRALKDDPEDQEAHAALVELYTETQSWEYLCDILEEHVPYCATPEESRRTRAKLAEVAAMHGQPDRAALHAGSLLSSAQIGQDELDLVEKVANTLGDSELLRGTLERRVKEAADPRVQIAALERLSALAQEKGDSARAIDKLRQAADVARSTGDEAAAIGLLERLCLVLPNDRSATNQLIELHERREEWARVPALYETLLKTTEDVAERVRLLRGLSKILAERLGDLKGAFQAARNALALAPSDFELLAELEILAIKTSAAQEFADAIMDALAATMDAPPESTRGAPADAPSTAWTELTLAKARVMATQKSTWDDASAAFRAVLQKATDDGHLSAASEGLGNLLRSMPPSAPRTNDARWLNQWKVERSSADQRTRALYAWAQQEEQDIGDQPAALGLYRRVLAADENDVDALAAVARLALAQGDVDGAIAALMQRRSVSEGEARNALDVQIATIQADSQGRPRDALDRIAGVLDSSPHDAGALDLAARLLKNPEVARRAAEVLEKSLDAVDDPDVKADVLEKLLVAQEEPRLDLYERLLDLLQEAEKTPRAYDVALRAARAMPEEPNVWDRAEAIARLAHDGEPLADAYREVLERDLPKEQAIELGQRAVAFYEEWFEDGGRVVGILERLLTIEPQDTWAFDRLKLIFDAQERWDDLFRLYDRAAAAADKERRMELLEEAAQIAKDFANHSARAIGYLEQLLDLKPGNARLASSLERLYERHGCHRELIALLNGRLAALPHEEAQKERARIASLWLNELGEAANALLVVEDILAHQPADNGVPTIDVTDLLERVLAVAPPHAEVRDSIMPPPGGDTPSERLSVPPEDRPPPKKRRGEGASIAPPKRGLVRQRAAALLKERYSVPGREADLARVLEVELEVVKSVKERIRRHAQIAAIHAQLGNDERAMEHYVQLVLLEPEVASHRTELATLAERVGKFDRLAEVLVSAADDCNDDALRVELLMHAGKVCAEKMGDRDRAISLFFRILVISPIADAALLDACRDVEPLLMQAERKTERLDVLERLAILEDAPDVRMHVLGEAARLATELAEDDRAIWAWEGRLEINADDAEALDGLVSLFDKGERWRPLIGVLERRSKLEGRDAGAARADRLRVAEILGGKLDSVEEAIATWQDIEQTFGESDDGTRALTMLYKGTKRWDDLAALLGRAAQRVEVGPPRAEALRELGDVQREQLDDPAAAIKSYEAALTEDAKNEGARSGLRMLLKRADHRAEVVRVLLAAYYAADDWRLVLDLTEHRLSAAVEIADQIAVLMESAEISEKRAQDPDAAFALVRRALLLDPGVARSVDELFRLAEATRAFRPLADAMRECIEAVEGSELPWTRALRFKMGGVLETNLDEMRSALDAYVHVAAQQPNDLDATKAVIRVAAKTMRWDAAARAVVESTRALGELEASLLAAIEEAATASNGWDAVTFALASLVHDGGGLAPGLARDIEAQIALWHRDRRGDPDAAESAFARALAHDPTNAQILSELAALQRRGKGRPLVDSLLRLSQATGGDLDLLTEAADTALGSVGDRGLAKSIFDRLLKLASERWLGATQPDITAGTPAAPEVYVDRAARELVKIYGEDGDHEKVVQLLVDSAHLPWPTEKARQLRHQAARAAVEKLHAPDRAITIYLGLLDEDPHDDQAAGSLVALYESGGRRAELLDLKKRLVGTARSVEERLALRLEIAKLEDAVSDASHAIAALEENLREAPRDAATVRDLATMFTRDGKHADLEKLLASQAALAREAGENQAAADLFAQAAEVSESKLSDLEKAIAHLKCVVELEPRAPSYDALARLSTQVKDHEAASGWLDKLRELASDKDRPAVTLRLADALVAANRKADAQSRLESEIQRDPEADGVRRRLADVYRKSESWTSLAELLTEGATHAPDKATRLARLREAADLHRARTGEPERAIPLLEQASDLSPDDNAVKLALADALGAAQRFEEARTLLRTLVEGFGGRRPKERAPVHYHLAKLDLALGDRARALVELDAATRIDPANPEILRALAELARDDGQLDRAERSYRALLTVLRRQESTAEDAPVTRSEVMFELSQIATRQGEPDRAKEILESAFELATENHVEARRLEGALRAKEDWTSLARALEGRLARGSAPDAAEISSELGRLYEEHLGRAGEAFEMHLRALDLDPKNEAVLDAGQRVAAAAGKMDVYEQKLRTLADRASGFAEGDPELAAALFVRLAKLAESLRHDDREAAKLYERAVEIHSTDRDVLAALDKVYERLGDDRGQARVLGMRVELDEAAGGASADAVYRLAQLRFRSGDVDSGCDAFEVAWAATPDEERALAILQAAADAHPKSARLIDIYERLARAPDHERVLVDALVRRWALPGATTEPMREAVQIAQNLGDSELAESLLRRWLESGHEDAEGRVYALTLLAKIVEASGKVREAVLLRREAAEIAPPDQARGLLFEVAKGAAGPLDDLRLAGTIYEELHERDPADREAWLPLLDVYRRMQDFTRLTQLLQEVTGYVDDPQERSRLRLERVKVGMEKLRLSDDDASRDLRDIVDEDPTNTDAAILLGTIIERSGRPEDLIELLGKQLDAAKDRQDAPSVSSLSKRLGELLETRQPDDARNIYYAALDWDPKARDILAALERIHRSGGEQDALADVIERRLAIETGDDAERLALSLAEMRKDDPEAATRALEIGFKGAPGSRQLRDKLEAVYREQLEYDKLAQLWVTDARGRSDLAERAKRLRDAAKIYRDELSDPEQGASLLREAREADPTDPGLLDELVEMLTASGELKQAESELT